MTVIVRSRGKYILLYGDHLPTLRHEVPRKNKFFKEELRLFREELVSWMCNKSCDELEVYKPPAMSFYRRALYHAIFKALQRRDGLVLIKTYKEESHVIR